MFNIYKIIFADDNIVWITVKYLIFSAVMWSDRYLIG